MPRSVEAPFNRKVHSATRAEGNEKLVLAELRLERHHLSVWFDNTTDTFHYERREHGRLKAEAKRKDDVQPLSDMMLEAAFEIINRRNNERRFEKKTAISRDWLPDNLEQPIRQFEPSKRPQSRSLFERYKPCDPSEWD